MNRHVVVRTIDRADPAVVDALGADRHRDGARGDRPRRVRRAELRPIQQDVRIGGSAVTVLSHPGDNLMIHAAVEVCQPGDILVVVNTAPSTHGMFGDLLATSLMARGVRGLVIDAGIRDTTDLRAMGFPVWSQYVSLPGHREEHARLGERAGGARRARSCNPGDVVCADDDGVVVVPRADAAWALDQSEAPHRQGSGDPRAARARRARRRLLRPAAKLAELGVEYVDRLD